jgi:hypothetical protein
LRGLCLATILWAISSRAVELPAGWRHVQTFNIQSAGMVKFSLPIATLDAARPGLEDLRLCDDAGAEIPFLIEHPTASPRVIRRARSFQVSLQPNTTVITLETGLTEPIEAVTLETPANNFLKAVKVEGSRDGRGWQTLAVGQPIFQQAGGASELRAAFPVGTWPGLRLTVDDGRTGAIPFTGARVHTAVGETSPGETLDAGIAERYENPGETRLRLNLGAANLDLAALQLETTEPLFTRSVTVAVAQVTDEAIREQSVSQGVIYRVKIDGQAASSNLTVNVGGQIRSRELLVLIRNEDSPPLTVSAVRVERRPVQLVFRARAAGAFHLLTGNRNCAAPRYDLAALSANLKSIPVSPVPLSALAENPGYRAPEVLPELGTNGTTLDVSAWRFRKAVKLTHSGVQLMEFDADVLAHAQSNFQDVRLLRAGQQVPYILERTSITRANAPSVVATNDAKDKALGRWRIQLPRAGLPLTRLSFTTRSALFDRNFVLYETASDERGEKFQREIGRVSWVRTSERQGRERVLNFETTPVGDVLWLETNNGDNAPVELDHFRVFHPVTRMLFKAEVDDDLMLYYGQPKAGAPRYDLSLVAGQLLAAEKNPVTLVAEEQLRAAPWSERELPGTGGVLLWGILAVVVVGLLLVIAWLLPKSPPPAGS